MGNEYGAWLAIETISSEMAWELLKDSDLSPGGILGMDQDKVHHFMDLMLGKGGRWYPTMSAIWIDPDGKLRDGFHRLLASANLGCTIDVLVV